MRKYEMFGKLNPDGVIVYADDQFINRQFLQISLEESQVANRCHIFQDGQQVLDFFDSVIATIEESSSGKECVQPISLLLLDINMPIVDGLQTTKLMQ